MKTVRNLIGILLLAAVGYACEPEELPADDFSTEAYGDQADEIIGSDGEPVRR